MEGSNSTIRSADCNVGEKGELKTLGMEYSWDEKNKYVHKFTLETCEEADCFNAVN